MIVRWVRRKIEKQNRKRTAILTLKRQLAFLWAKAQSQRGTLKTHYEIYIRYLRAHVEKYKTGSEELEKMTKKLADHIVFLEKDKKRRLFLAQYFQYRELVKKTIKREGLEHVLIDTKPLLKLKKLIRTARQNTPLDESLLKRTNVGAYKIQQGLLEDKKFWREVKLIDSAPVLPFLDTKRFLWKKIWKKNTHRLFNKPSKPCEYTNDMAPLAKIIFPNGKSRGYFAYLLRYLYSIENLFFRNATSRSYKPRKLERNKLQIIQKRLLKWSRYYNATDILSLFNYYIKLTEPVLAYYLVKKRSFKRQKKIYKINYSLKMTFGLRRRNKLYHQAKAFFYSNKTRRKKGHLRYSTLSFFEEEFMNMGESTMLKSKKRIYNKFGGEVMNNILHHETQSNRRRWLSGRALGWNPRGQMFDSSSLQYEILTSRNTWGSCSGVQYPWFPSILSMLVSISICAVRDYGNSFNKSHREGYSMGCKTLSFKTTNVLTTAYTRHIKSWSRNHKNTQKGNLIFNPHYSLRHTRSN